MRMDPTPRPARSHLVNRMSERELAAAAARTGRRDDAPRDRPAHRRAAHAPAHHHDPGPDGHRLRGPRLHDRARAGAKLHPAARTFQALRILVNRELANLERLLAVLPDVLAPGGAAAIISFHSGEDRRVKAAFKEGLRAGVYEDVSREPLVANEEEIRRNGRSRSAKLGGRFVRETGAPSASRGRLARDARAAHAVSRIRNYIPNSALRRAAAFTASCISFAAPPLSR